MKSYKERMIEAIREREETKQKIIRDAEIEAELLYLHCGGKIKNESLEYFCENVKNDEGFNNKFVYSYYIENYIKDKSTKYKEIFFNKLCSFIKNDLVDLLPIRCRWEVSAAEAYDVEIFISITMILLEE